MSRGPGFPGEGVSFALPRLTPAVRFLLLSNLGVFLASLAASLASPEAERFVLEVFGLVPGAVLRLPPFLWQLGTYAFLHSTHALSHLLFNLLALYMLGTLVEGWKGTRWFVRLYAVSALAGGLAHVVYGSLRYAGDVPCIGASGAVLGVVLSAARLHPRLTVLFWFVPLPLWVLASILVALDGIPVLREIASGSPVDGISHAAHLGGAVAGYLWTGAPASLTEGRWLSSGPLISLGRFLERRRRAGEEGRRRRMDAILARIADQGISSLSGAERRFLVRESRRARARKGGRP